MTKDQRIKELMRQANDLIRESEEATGWNKRAIALGLAAKVIAELEDVRCS
jgi:hypothetical protein